MMPAHGFTGIFENMLKNEKIEVRLKTDAKSCLKVDLENKQILFEGEAFQGPVIFTGAIDDLLDYPLGELPYRSLEFDIQSHPHTYQEAATVNYPTPAQQNAYPHHGIQTPDAGGSAAGSDDHRCRIPADLPSRWGNWKHPVLSDRQRRMPPSVSGVLRADPRDRQSSSLRPFGRISILQHGRDRCESLANVQQIKRSLALLAKEERMTEIC